MGYFKNKTILVTGATGLVGYNLINRLHDIEGVRIVAISRSLDKLKRTFSHINSQNVIQYVEHDISLPLPDYIGHIDIVFHAASPISSKVISTEPVNTISSNINGISNCLEYIKKQGFGKVIVFSSATVYGNRTGLNICKETDDTYASSLQAANAPYAESKRMIEVISHAYHKEYGIDILILRLSYIYGYSPNPANTAFYQFIETVRQNKNINFRTAGLPGRDNIYVEDAIDAILCILNSNTEECVFNISSNGELGNFASADEIARIVVDQYNKLMKSDLKLIYEFNANVDKTSKEKNGLLLDNNKIKELGWIPQTSLTQGIQETLDKMTDYNE